MNIADTNRTRPEITAGGRLTIDLTALAANWLTLAAIAAGAETAAAVKGNAYGVGLEQAAKALDEAGCRTFFVALPAEGLRLRAVLPDSVIYVLNGLAPGSADALGRARLRPVLGSLAEIDEWAATRPRDAAAALHVDTGMNRLGLTLDEARHLAAKGAAVGGLGLSLVMSHLACADTPSDPLTALQLSRFRTVIGLFPGLPASLANSAGTTLGPDYRFDLVRPGIALYGGASVKGRPPLDTVATVEAGIIQIRDVAKGDAIGYGAAEIAKRDSRIAILSAGYADGYLRAAGSTDARPGAHAFLRGRKVPLIGRVSMDLIAIDVTDVPTAGRGDMVELIGPNIKLDEVAAAAGTIGYELLTSLGDRFERRVIGGS